MKLTDEEREELKELYKSYKDVKDVDSLKLLGGLIRTSKWYKNHKLTYDCLWNSPIDYYTIVSLKFIFSNLNLKLYPYNKPTPLIVIFLKSLITRKHSLIYKLV
jgi:hypothetical protein